MKDGLNKKDSSAYLGEGETDFAGTMEVLKKANYKGWLHLENFYGRKPLCDTQASFIEVAKHDLALRKRACGSAKGNTADCHDAVIRMWKSTSAI